MSFPVYKALFARRKSRPVGSSRLEETYGLVGVTLVETLVTQRGGRGREPINELVIPPGVAEPFLTIVHNCLRPQAEDRWTAEQISTALHAPPAAPKKSSRWLYAIPAAVVLIVLAV